MNKSTQILTHKGVSVAIEVITPTMAQKWLAKANEDNFRKINQSNYEKILSDIEDGRFLFTHQGIAFDKNGNILDGQHRLRAIVDADKSVTMAVWRGLDPATMNLIDSGRVRDYHTKLVMAGQTQGREVHSAIRLLSNLIEGRPAYYSPNHIDALCQLLESEAASINKIQELVKEATDHKNQVKLRAHTASFLFASLLGFHVDENKTRLFLQRYVSGVAIFSQKDPAQRARLFANGISGCRDPRIPQVSGVFMHCLALHLQCKDDIGVVKFSQTEKGVRWLIQASGLAAKDKPLSKTFLPGSAHIGGGGQ